MSRSKWKSNFVNTKILLDSKVSYKETSMKKLWCRNEVIPGAMINKTLFVHNGRDFIKILISRDKVGYKLGEFAFTRKHSISKKLAKLKKKALLKASSSAKTKKS
jgi:small subunit ribosomal protein S19